MVSLRELKLSIQAARLIAAAQRIRQGDPLPRVLDELCRRRGLPRSVATAEGFRAVERAAWRLGRLGLAGTCLIRSLALAALISDRDDVELHLGFRPTGSPEALLSGHAWVTVGGSPIPDANATLLEGEPCEDVAVLIVNRPGHLREEKSRP